MVVNRVFDIFFSNYEVTALIVGGEMCSAKKIFAINSLQISDICAKS